MTRTAGIAGADPVRRGGRHWLRSYRLMLVRDLIGLRVQLVMLGVSQVLVGAGMALIYGFVLGDAADSRAIFLVTGAPVLALVPVGVVLLPNVIGELKARGSYDFTWTLPVPRTATAAATCTAFAAVALPGTVVALLAATWRYDVDLVVSPSIVPAALLTAAMGASVGFGLGHAIEDPRHTNLVTNLVMFLLLMYSPVAFPIEQFPDWLGAVHHVLPFHHMAVLVRAGLTEGVISDLARSYLVVGAWLVAGWATALGAIARRR